MQGLLLVIGVFVGSVIARRCWDWGHQLRYDAYRDPNAVDTNRIRRLVAITLFSVCGFLTLVIVKNLLHVIAYGFQHGKL